MREQQQPLPNTHVDSFETKTYLMSDALADAPPGSHDVLDKRPFSPHHCDDLLQAGDSDDLGRESPPARGDFDAPGMRAGGAVGPSMGTSSRKRSRSPDENQSCFLSEELLAAARAAEAAER